MTVDQYFTPASIASAMVSFFRRRAASLVADFAAGNGDLLAAARSRWPTCGVVATDIDESRVYMLRKSQPSWSVGKCDFLNPVSRKQSRILRKAKGNVSLVLLNPPFSCRGNERLPVALDGEKVLCSRAMAFVVNSIPYLSATGHVAAVLPAGCLTSQKDAEAWGIMRRAFDVRVLSSHGLRTFKGCAARTVVVCLSRLRAGTRTSRKRRPCRKQTTGITVRITRGVVPVHEAMNGAAGPGWPFVHTANLRQSMVTQLGHSVRTLRRYATGPCVLIPRVGQPDSEKCVLYLARKRVVLSDCIFAIRCESSEDARLVHRAILRSWDKVRESYCGTCARYITRGGLRGLLGNLGFGIGD